MIGRRAVAGLSLICALVFCAFAAQGASAANGTTAFTCVKGAVNSGDFKDVHCEENVGANKGEYKHEVIALNTTTAIEGNATGVSTLNSIQAGIVTEISCKKSVATGHLKNTEPSEGKHTLDGENINIVYSECTVPKPAKGECVVKGGKVEVPAAVSMDVENVHGFEMGIKFDPGEAGKPFATFSLEGCKVGGLNIKYKAEGSALGVPKGATLIFNKESTEPTLTLNGQKASFTSTVTQRMTGAGGNPITTTTTP